LSAGPVDNLQEGLLIGLIVVGQNGIYLKSKLLLNF